VLVRILVAHHHVAGSGLATGQVTAASKPRHRHQEFLAFLRQVANMVEVRAERSRASAAQPIQVGRVLGAFPFLSVVKLTSAAR
jgi:hypothetical protein